MSLGEKPKEEWKLYKFVSGRETQTGVEVIDLLLGEKLREAWGLLFVTGKNSKEAQWRLFGELLLYHNIMDYANLYCIIIM